MSRDSFSLHIPSGSTSSRSSSRPVSPRLPTDVFDSESLSSDESPQGRRASYAAPTQYHHHHFHHNNFFAHSTTSSSNLTSAYHTPSQSRSSSPSPYPNQYFNSEDDQVYNSLLGRGANGRFAPQFIPARRKWTEGSSRRGRRRLANQPMWKRVFSALVSHPLFPAQPSTIVSPPNHIFPISHCEREIMPIASHCDCYSNYGTFYHSLPNVPPESRQISPPMAVILCFVSAIPRG